MYEPGGFSDLRPGLGDTLSIDQIRPCKRETVAQQCT